MVDLPVRALAVRAAVGHEAAPDALKVGNAGLTQNSKAVGAGVSVRVGALFLRGNSGAWFLHVGRMTRTGALVALGRKRHNLVFCCSCSHRLHRWWCPVGLGDAKRLVVDLPVRALAVLAAVGHEAAPGALEDSGAGAAQYSEAVGAGLGVRGGVLLLWESVLSRGHGFWAIDEDWVLLHRAITT